MAFRSAGSVREYLGVPDDDRQGIVDLVSGGVRQSRDRPKPLSTRLRLEQSRVLQENRGLLADRLEKRDLPHRQAARLRPPDEVQDAGDLGAGRGDDPAGRAGGGRGGGGVSRGRPPGRPFGGRGRRGGGGGRPPPPAAGPPRSGAAPPRAGRRPPQQTPPHPSAGPPSARS